MYIREEGLEDKRLSADSGEGNEHFKPFLFESTVDLWSYKIAYQMIL